MKTAIGLGLGALALAAVAIAASPLQDAKAKARDEKPSTMQQGGDMDAMMEAWMKAGTPGEVHADLAKCAGAWKATVKHWNPMDPSGEPGVSEGRSHIEMALGGRYMIERFTGEMPGMGPFEGMGILAYNNITDEFEHVWMDSMSTGMMHSRGKKQPDGSVTLRGEFDDAMTGQKIQCRMVTRDVSDNERVFEMYCNQSGKEQQSMEITYKRAN